MAHLREVPTEDLLSFQDFSSHPGNINVAHSASTSVNIPDELQPSAPIDNYHEENTNTQGSPQFWTFKYYQQFFNVTTDDVVQRIIASMMPKRSDMTSHNPMSIYNEPDLYGPIWISLTLVFVIAISGNIANYLQYAARSEHYTWRYDFHLVSYAATAIYCYVFILPLCIWLYVKNKGAHNPLYAQSVADDFQDSSGSSNKSDWGPLYLICAYGYSISIYIPVAILWTIQIDFLQWMLTIAAACLSGLVLVRSVWPYCSNVQGSSQLRLLLLLFVAGMHFLLAMGFMLCFFHVIPVTVPTPSVHLPPSNVYLVNTSHLNNTL